MRQAWRWIGLGVTLWVLACGGKATGVATNRDGDGGTELPPCAPGADAGDCEPISGNFFVDSINQSSAGKIDLLFMIDNSISMGDKHDLLAEAVPDLVERLVNPVCVDPDTGDVAAPPSSIDEPCPAPYLRQFAPVRDIHIGVVSSSLGSYGASACVPEPALADPLRDEMQNDHGRMIGARPRALSQGLGLASSPDGTPGFLIWDVTGGRMQSLSDLQSQFQSLVTVTGSKGCGFEASLEAWYRFLVDPAPPAEVQVVQCPGGGDCAQPIGTDDLLLAQRTAFLRADSVLAIVMLTDENDCSVQGTGQLYYAVRNISMPSATAVCAANPNDPCCQSCAFPILEGCPPDPTCTGAGGAVPYVPDDQDSFNLRCWNQKRRFGVDFLHPVDRYVNALRETSICVERPDLSVERCPQSPIPNPIFTDLTGAGGAVRSPDQVFLAGIVGVPWQAIAADVDAEGNPLPPRDDDGDGVVDNLTFLTADQMAGQAADGVARDTWAVILGSPEASPPILPIDALMHESILPRAGTTFDGIPLAGPSSAPYANAINGHEWNVVNGDDLQYACIFQLPEPKDCVAEAARGNGCDCQGVAEVQAEQKPLCQNPVDGTYSEIQYASKAYPALRILEVLRTLGSNAIVTSVCPANTTDATRPSYGYRPAMSAIVDRLEEGLRGRCLPRELTVQAPSGPGQPQSIPCRILEAVPNAGVGCNRAGRTEVPSIVVEGVFRRLEEEGRCGVESSAACDVSAWTICEVEPATADDNGDGTIDCLQDLPPPAEVGWCYVDPSKGAGDAALVQKCPATEKRLIRFVDRDGDTPTKTATLLIACTGPELN